MTKIIDNGETIDFNESLILVKMIENIVSISRFSSPTKISYINSLKDFPLNKVDKLFSKINCSISSKSIPSKISLTL